jgi:hypothetical protein
MSGRCLGCTSGIVIQRADGRSDHRRLHPAVITHVPRKNEGRRAKAPITWGEVCRTTERAGAHSLQFGTYALWAAGLLAALAVRPVPSCTVSVARSVNDQAPNDVRPGQAACSCLRSVMTLGPDHQYPAKSGELPWNPLHARSAANEDVRRLPSWQQRLIPGHSAMIYRWPTTCVSSPRMTSH